EVRVRIRPLDLRDGPDQPHRPVAVELGGERMVRPRGNCAQQSERDQRSDGCKSGVHGEEDRWALAEGQGDRIALTLRRGAPRIHELRLLMTMIRTTTMRTRVLATATVLLCVSALAISRPRAADSLPSQLSDQEFWKLSSDFSEPDGFFRSDNLLSNEVWLQN